MRVDPSDGGMAPGLKEERDAEFYQCPRTMLETLANERIIAFELESDSSVWLTEGCDDWFSIELTKAEFSQLIEELEALRDRMEG